jgi:hypothetical protein
MKIIESHNKELSDITIKPWKIHKLDENTILSAQKIKENDNFNVFSAVFKNFKIGDLYSHKLKCRTLLGHEWVIRCSYLEMRDIIALNPQKLEILFYVPKYKESRFAGHWHLLYYKIVQL